jgi:glycosyltransferase involved in cell wall biosynthesis
MNDLVLISIGHVRYPNGLGALSQDVLTYRGLCRELRRVYVIVASNQRCGFVRRFDRVVFIGVPQGYGWVGDKIAFMRGVDRICERIRKHSGVDVVSASDPLLSGLAGLRFSRAAGRPLLVHVQGQVLDFPRGGIGWVRRRLIQGLAAFVCKRADRVRCVSRQISQSVKDLGVPLDRIVYLPSRVDLTVFSPSRRRSLGAPIRGRFGLADAPLVVFIGSFTAFKGVRTLLDAFRAVRRSIPAAVLMMIGSGPLWKEIALYVSDSRLEDSIILPGRVEHHEVPRYLAAANVLVLPSENEGLPRVMLEALAMETPVIATAVGGIPELVVDGHSGRLVCPGSVEQLARAIIEVLLDPERAKEMARHGRQGLDEGFDWEVNLKRYASMVVDVSRNRRSGG